jgi:hypothetical protein
MKRKICHILFLGASLLFIIRCKSDFIDVSCDSPVILTSLEDNKITYDFSYSDLSLNKVKTTYINAYDEKFYLYSTFQVMNLTVLCRRLLKFQMNIELIILI